MTKVLNEPEIERAVKDLYSELAESPGGQFHFTPGRELAEHVGYPSEELDSIPESAIESFAGVGYHFDLANLQEGDDVIDLGSGSGTDAFIAARHVGESGSVTGLDMTEEQLEKARQIRDDADIANVSFEQGKIEDIPIGDATFDVAISNGVINTSPAKDRVFDEISRVLRSGGRFAISDINSQSEIPKNVKADADLWAACVGGACQTDVYSRNLRRVGMTDVKIRENPETQLTEVFTTDRAKNACGKYGIRSVSVQAYKP